MAKREEIDVAWWLKRYESARSRRTTWDDHWRDIDEFFWPRTDGFTGEGRGNVGGGWGGGEKRMERVYDITAPLALDRGAAGLSALVIPQSERWHTLRASDDALNDVPAVKKWFEDVTELLFDMRASPKANYYSQAHEGFMSELAFGNHCQFIDESKGGGVRYRNVHIGQVWIDVDHQGRVDTIYRRMLLTAKAAVQQFGKVWGKGGAPQKIRQALEQGRLEEFEFVHIVSPRDNVDPESLDVDSMPWMELYIFPDERLLIEEGAYEELPYQYPRWSISPNENYGRSPGMLCLPGVKVLNEQEHTLLRSGHLKVDPPLLGRDDGAFGSGGKRPRFKPGSYHAGMVNMQGQSLVQPLVTGADIESTFEMMNAKREQLQGAFYLDLFRMFTDNPKMTATEVLERVTEKGQLLAPAIGRIQSEWLGPQIHRELGILGRQGALPPMPEEMIEAGAGYEVEYVAQAQRMQRSREMVAFNRTVEMALPFAQVNPKVLQKFNIEKAIEHSMDVFGGPSDLLRTDEEYAEIVAQLAEQEAQAAQMAIMEQGAGAARDGAQAVSSLASIQGGAAA